jgi:hypothetical protein
MPHSASFFRLAGVSWLAFIGMSRHAMACLNPASFSGCVSRVRSIDLILSRDVAFEEIGAEVRVFPVLRRSCVVVLVANEPNGFIAGGVVLVLVVVVANEMNEFILPGGVAFVRPGDDF